MGQIAKRKKKLIEDADNVLSVKNKFQFEPLTEEQKQAWEVLQNNTITFLIGTCGSGKTFCALAAAINELLSKSIDKIYLSRPLIEVGGKSTMGYLPGSADAKLGPWTAPFSDCLEQLIGHDSSIHRRIHLAPIAYLRGRSFNNVAFICDESQNLFYEEFLMILTRLGNGSKMIFTGDPSQSDLGKKSGLLEVASRLQDIENIGTFWFSENGIVRHPLVRTIVERLR